MADSDFWSQYAEKQDLRKWPMRYLFIATRAINHSIVPLAWGSTLCFMCVAMLAPSFTPAWLYHVAIRGGMALLLIVWLWGEWLRKRKPHILRDRPQIVASWTAWSSLTGNDQVILAGFVAVWAVFCIGFGAGFGLFLANFLGKVL